MTVKKKLIVSNILMIVIPVLLALLFVIVSFKTVGNRYWESMEEMYDDKSGIYSAQSILFAYKNEIRDRSDLEYQKSEDGRTKGFTGKDQCDGQPGTGTAGSWYLSVFGWMKRPCGVRSLMKMRNGWRSILRKTMTTLDFLP